MSFLLLTIFLTVTPRPAAAQDKSGVKPQVISLPSGPGLLEGLGENFEPNLSTGTSSYPVKFIAAPGRVNFQPEISLNYIEYFNELHQIDVSTRYATLMQAFVNQPNLELLFAGYWQEYIGQFPEAIFTKVNENFYRSTFFELCSRYLSNRTYPFLTQSRRALGAISTRLSAILDLYA